MLYKTDNPHGGDVYGTGIDLDFSANTNPFGTPQSVLDTMADALHQVHRYPDPYCRELVRAIADHESVPEHYILCGNGAAELIHAYARSIRAGSAVELAPTFSEYSSALERTGCRVDRYFLRQENNFDMDGGFLNFLGEKNPDAVFLCSPNNPTGRLIPQDILEQVLCFCRRNSIRLFLDECFLNLTEQGVSMTAYLEDYPGLLILKAFTKCYGMAGVRLGYCLSSDDVLLSEMAKESQPWNVSVLAQAAGAAALKEDAFVKKARDLISEERRWLSGELQSMGFLVCPSEANYVLFQGEPGLDAELKKSRIAIRNCDNYYGLGPGWYRTAVRLHEENERLIHTMRQITGEEHHG